MQTLFRKCVRNHIAPALAGVRRDKTTESRLKPGLYKAANSSHTLSQTSRQRNSGNDNEQIKQGHRPESFDENPSKGRQKDTDARGTREHHRNYFGYKNHVNVDADLKFIRRFTVTDAALHESQAVKDLLDPQNSNADVYGDSAYRSAAIRDHMETHGYRDRIHRKGVRGRPLNERGKAANTRKSKVRARVEHVFGRPAQFACHTGGTLMRRMGIARTEARVGLRKLL